MSGLLVEGLEVGLYRRDVRDDAVLRQVGHDLLEGRYGVLHCHGIDDQFGCEGLHLVHGCEALTVVGEAHALRIPLNDGHIVVETEQVDEEGAHLSGSHHENLHISIRLRFVVAAVRSLRG